MADSTSVASLANYAESTEFGVPRTLNASLGQHYAWLGTKQRSTDDLGGLTLMGARLYNPETGRFLSHDPVRGGNDNTYVYPADPINMLDTSGLFGWLALAGYAGEAIAGASASDVIAVVGVAALATIAVGAIWHGKHWAVKKVEALYNKAAGKKKKKAKKSGKASANDVPSWAHDVRLHPGESIDRAMKRIMGSRYPKSSKGRGPGSDYSKIKKRLTRR